MLPRPLAGVGAVLPSGALAEGLRTALSAGHAPSAVQVLVLVGWTVVASALALRTVKLR
jgi:ABC-2 type transport system permease protein